MAVTSTIAASDHLMILVTDTRSLTTGVGTGGGDVCSFMEMPATGFGALWGKRGGAQSEERAGLFARGQLRSNMTKASLRKRLRKRSQSTARTANPPRT